MTHNVLQIATRGFRNLLTAAVICVLALNTANAQQNLTTKADFLKGLKEKKAKLEQLQKAKVKEAKEMANASKSAKSFSAPSKNSPQTDITIIPNSAYYEIANTDTAFTQHFTLKNTTDETISFYPTISYADLPDFEINSNNSISFEGGIFDSIDYGCEYYVEADSVAFTCIDLGEAFFYLVLNAKTHELISSKISFDYPYVDGVFDGQYVWLYNPLYTKFDAFNLDGSLAEKSFKVAGMEIDNDWDYCYSVSLTKDKNIAFYSTQDHSKIHVLDTKGKELEVYDINSNYYFTSLKYNPTDDMWYGNEDDYYNRIMKLILFNHTLIDIDYSYCSRAQIITLGNEFYAYFYNNGGALCNVKDVFPNRYIKYNGNIITLAPGELKTIKLDIDTKQAIVANPEATLYLQTEDYDYINEAGIYIEPQKYDLNFFTNKQAIDFGLVDITSTNKQTISLVNKGFDFYLQNAYCVNNTCYIDACTDYASNKGDSIVIDIYTKNLSNQSKEYTDTLLISIKNYNHNLDSTIRIPIKAKTVEKATYTATNESNIDIKAGQIAKASVLVTNTSSNINLNYSISPLYEKDIAITIYSGDYADEIGWEILDNNGNVVFSKSYGTYTTHSHYYYDTITLKPGTYTFVAKDSYGDGWNGGYYTLTDDYGNLIVKGGDSGFSITETKQFNIELSELIYLATGTIEKNTSKQIEFDVPNSNTFIEGATNEVSYIITTDAAQNNTILSYTINVTDGKLIAEVQNFSIKDAGVNIKSLDTISIINKGNKVFNATSVYLKNNSNFWCEGYVVIDTQIDIVLGFEPDSIGQFTDTIVVALSDTTLNIPIAANGYGSPSIKINNRYYSNNTPSIVFGDTNAKIPNDTITISNVGSADLKLSILNYSQGSIEIDSILSSYVSIRIIDAKDINNQNTYPQFYTDGSAEEVNGLEETIYLLPGKYALMMYASDNNYGKDGFVRVTFNGNTTTYKFDGAADSIYYEMGLPIFNTKTFEFEVMPESIIDNVVIAPAKDTTLIVPLTWNIENAGVNRTTYFINSNASPSSIPSFCSLEVSSNNFAYTLSKPAFDISVVKNSYPYYLYDTIWVKNVSDFVMTKNLSYTNTNSYINRCYFTNYNYINRGDSVGIVICLRYSTTVGTFEETVTLTLNNVYNNSNNTTVNIPLKFKVEDYYTITTVNRTPTLNANCGDTTANIVATLKNNNSGTMTYYVFNSKINHYTNADTIILAANDTVNVTIPVVIKEVADQSYAYAKISSPQANNPSEIGSQVLYANATPSYEYNKSAIAMTNIAKNEYSTSKLSLSNTGCVNINIVKFYIADGEYFNFDNYNYSTTIKPNTSDNICRVKFIGSDSIATYTDTLFVKTNIGIDTILVSAEVTNTKPVAFGTTYANYAYNAGKEIDLSLSFNSVISLIDTTNNNSLPSITMNTGRKAVFSNVVGNELHFAYTVAENENIDRLSFATNNGIADIDMNNCIVIDYNDDTVLFVATSTMVDKFNNLYRIKLDNKAAELTTNANSLLAYYNDTVKVTFDFNEGVFGFVHDSITATNATATLIANSSKNYIVTIVPSAEGEVTTNINLCVADSAGNITTEKYAIAFTYDVTAPVITLEADGNVSPVVFTVNVSEKIKALDDKKFKIKGGKITKVDVVNLTFTVEADANAKQIVLTAAEGAITDLAGNASAAASKTVDLKSDAVNEQLANISVYPNPASDYVNVVAADGATIEVFAVTGAKVIVEQSNGSINRIDLTNLAAGNYIVRVISNDAVEVKQITKE